MRLEGPADIAEAIKEYGPKATTEWQRLNCFEAYFVRKHRPPYLPETATREFKELVHRSITNLTRLVVVTLAQRLFVDGFRASAVAEANAPQWQWWQANGLDSRQKAVYTEVFKHGYAGVLVAPGDPVPVMRPVTPREWWLGFDSFDDDWLMLALKQVDEKTWHVLDDRARYVVETSAGGGDVVVLEENVHDLDHVPIVPFRNEWNLTDYPEGEIAPAIDVQDRLNQTVFDLLVAQTYAAAPQKWASGLVLPTDDKGRPITDIRAFAKSLWATSEKDAKFGSLPEANLKNIVEAIEQTLRMYGLMTQTPPHYLLGDLVNLPLALDTPVPTPTGMTTVGDLSAGDKVLAPDGQALDVLDKTPVFLGHDCYRLRFDDGTEVVADAQHRWRTTRFRSRLSAPYQRGRVTGDVTTKQIAESLLTCMGTNNHYIDVAEPYDGPEQDYVIPPYVLGVWLGDGDRVNGLITSHVDDADELADHLRAAGEIVTMRPYAPSDEMHRNCRLITVSYDHERCPRGHERARGTKYDSKSCVACAALSYRDTRYGEPMPDVTNVSFVKRLKTLGVWRNKYIPEAYFHGSFKQRLALLQGLMDTDGSTTPGGTVTFTCHDRRLAHDVARLIRSVGQKVALRETQAVTFDRTGTVTAWRMAWSATSPVFRLARKLERQRTEFGGGDGRSNAPLRHYIVACDPVPSVPVQCITVSGTEHLFLITESLIQTGNSAEALLAADTTLAKKTQDRQVILGEAWEQTFRLAGVAAGDDSAANDLDAQVWWRQTEPRSIAQQVDALGKLATMLGVPPQALWEDVPGMTGGTLARWKMEAARQRLREARQNLVGGVGQVAVAQASQGGTPGANIESKQARERLG
jgi:hypothetical protein